LPATLPVSAELRAVVARATARDPDERFASAHALAEALRAAATLEPTTISAPRLAAGSTRRMSRRTLIGVSAVVFVLLAGTAAILSHLRGARADAGATPPSLAVLSFENTSHDPKLAYFSDGIAQELQNALAELPGLSVASRTATDVWRGRAADPRDIARALGVTDLLEGGVARTQDSVRIYVRLVDGKTGRQRWRGRYDRKLADLFDVQEDVARSVAGELRVALAENGTTAIARSRTASIEAHDLVLRANYEMRTSRVPDLERTVSLADSALAIDPAYAPAWATKARALNYLALFRGRRSADVPRQARDAAARAVELDSLSADAQLSYGVLLFRYEWRWADAERHLQRAIALNPSLVEAHLQLARVLRSLGRFEDARAANVAAFRIDPGQRSRGLSLGRISYFARDYERAIRETRESPDTTLPAYFTWLGEAYMRAGRLAEAESLLMRDTTQTATAILLAKTGRMPQALRSLTNAERGREWTLEEIAEVYIALGDRERALDRLEQAVAEHDPLVVDFLVRPGLDPVRNEPRFQALMRKLAFPAAARFER
jgi:serine/threonine-protein kinase